VAALVGETGPLEAYLQAFKYGMPQHGGFALGLGRWIPASLVLAISARRRCSRATSTASRHSRTLVHACRSDPFPIHAAPFGSASTPGTGTPSPAA
jgi:hypothetical protein